MTKFEIIEKEILDKIKKSPLKFDPMHAKLTLKWLLKLKPDADESLKIAALAHDIDRAITGVTEKDCKDYSKIKVFKKEHALRSSKFTEEILRKHSYEEATIKRVKYLIEAHEEGGDEEQTILMEADSLAYFDYNIPGYNKRYGKERTIGKIRFMYTRLSEKARQLVREIGFKDEVKELFEEAISGL